MPILFPSSKIHVHYFVVFLLGCCSSSLNPKIKKKETGPRELEKIKHVEAQVELHNVSSSSLKHSLELGPIGVSVPENWTKLEYNYFGYCDNWSQQFKIGKALLILQRNLWKGAGPI